MHHPGQPRSFPDEAAKYGVRSWIRKPKDAVKLAPAASGLPPHRGTDSPPTENRGQNRFPTIAAMGTMSFPPDNNSPPHDSDRQGFPERARNARERSGFFEHQPGSLSVSSTA